MTMRITHNVLITVPNNIDPTPVIDALLHQGWDVEAIGDNRVVLGDAADGDTAAVVALALSFEFDEDLEDEAIFTFTYESVFEALMDSNTSYYSFFLGQDMGHVFWTVGTTLTLEEAPPGTDEDIDKKLLN